MPHTLLLADDSVTIQRVIELTFADEDIQVTAVSDGEQAIQRLEAAPPDIVLADIGMPGKDGYEVAAHIKKSPKLSHIPVVLLTGAFEPVDQARADALGCDGVLAKPFEPQIVIGRVKELLGRPPKAAAPPPSVAPVVSPERAAQLDGYFDRLDEAFATMSPKAPNGPPLDLPLSYASPKSQFEEPASAPRKQPEPVDVKPAAAAPTPSAAPAQHDKPSPPLADAFKSLLAAEPARPAAAQLPAPPAWPPPAAPAPAASALAPPPAPAADDLVEQVTRRVLDRLSDRVVREKVSEIVSAVAERVVREEIDRIKNRVK